jgi:uncharacterized protein (DUF2147 family)
MIFRKYSFLLFFLLLCTGVIASDDVLPASEQICGKWESSEKSLVIRIYMEDDQLQAKVLWYSDTNGKPLDYLTDKRNPDPKLRSRKILGMSVLSNMQYDPGTNSWGNGMIYDSQAGHSWNASANVDKKGLLNVRGYWHFKFIGKTMTFYRVGA